MIKPDFFESLAKLGQAMIYRQEYAAAESCFQQLLTAKNRTVRALGERNMIALACTQGKFKQALAEADRTMENRSGEWVPADLITFGALRAEVLSAMRDYPAAAKEAEQVVRTMQKERINGPVYLRMWLIAILLQNHDLSRAETVLGELKHDTEGLDSSSMLAYWSARGCVERAKGDLGAAIADLERGTRGNAFIPRHLSLALAYLDAKRFGDAARDLEAMTSNYFEESRLLRFGPILHFYLAGAYERTGETEKAAAQYERFLDIVKNADTVIPEVNDARQRLAQLKKKG